MPLDFDGDPDHDPDPGIFKNDCISYYYYHYSLTFITSVKEVMFMDITRHHSNYVRVIMVMTNNSNDNMKITDDSKNRKKTNKLEEWDKQNIS